jgi:hypothetical protein
MPRKSTKLAKSRANVSPAAEASPPDQTESLAATSQSANDQCDSRGRFTEGNAGGPGNPHARHCARMLEMFRNSITDEEMYGLCRVLFERASGGDMGSLKMIWQYKLGKPLPAPNPDMIDRDEWDHFQKDAMTLDEMRKVLGQLPSRIGNDIVSAALPSIASTISHSLAQQLLQGLPAESEPIPTAGSNGFLPAEPPSESPSPATLHTPLATHPSSGSNGYLPAKPARESSSPATLTHHSSLLGIKRVFTGARERGTSRPFFTRHRSLSTRHSPPTTHSSSPATLYPPLVPARYQTESRKRPQSAKGIAIPLTGSV